MPCVPKRDGLESRIILSSLFLVGHEIFSSEHLLFLTSLHMRKTLWTCVGRSLLTGEKNNIARHLLTCFVKDFNILTDLWRFAVPVRKPITVIGSYHQQFAGTRQHTKPSSRQTRKNGTGKIHVQHSLSRSDGDHHPIIGIDHIPYLSSKAARQIESETSRKKEKKQTWPFNNCNRTMISIPN